MIIVLSSCFWFFLREKCISKDELHNVDRKSSIWPGSWQLAIAGLDQPLQRWFVCVGWLLQAQKEALQSGLVTMHDIEMMAIDEEGTVLIYYQIFIFSLARYCYYWILHFLSHFWKLIQPGGGDQGSSQPKLPRLGRAFLMKKRAKMRLKSSSKGLYRIAIIVICFRKWVHCDFCFGSVFYLWHCCLSMVQWLKVCSCSIWCVRRKASYWSCCYNKCRSWSRCNDNMIRRDWN